MARLGKKQLDWLLRMSLPFFQVVSDRFTDNLIARGLARSCHRGKKGEHAFIQPSPAGLRALADALEKGQIDYPDPKRKGAA